MHSIGERALDAAGRAPEPDDVTALGLDDESAEAVFDALSSETGRAVLARLYDRPRTPSALADAVDTSVQNVGHHLDQLGAAGLVRVVGSEYSAQGRDMNVYGPTGEALVIYESTGPDRSPRAGFDAGRAASPESWFALGALAGAAAATVLRGLASRVGR